MAANKKTDYLKVDPPLVTECKKPQMRQTWAVVSFISPEERIKQRFIFEANRFLYNDVNKQLMDTTSHLVKDINLEVAKLLDKKINSYKTSNDKTYQAAAQILEGVKQDFQIDEDDQTNKVLRQYRIDHQDLIDRFETYKTRNNKELEADFVKECTPDTSVRGFKIRGAFEELAEAQARAKLATTDFEPAVHSFAVPIGYWCPWDPNADAVQDQEYMLPELNDLMGKYNRNVEQRNEFYQKRKQMMMDENNDSKDKSLKEKLRQKLIQKQAQRSEGHVNSNNNNQDQSVIKTKSKRKKKNKQITDAQKQENVTVTQDSQNKSLTFEIPK